MSNDTVSSNPYAGDYTWPKDLYTEMMDMCNLAFMCYDFAFLLDASRKVQKKGGTFIGLTVDENGNRVSKSDTKGTHLQRSFTPAELKDIILSNQTELSKHYRKFKDPSKMISTLDALQGRADASGLRNARPITLEEFDDKHQNKELVYAITKDNVNKRITIAFRGTTNNLAFKTNWQANLNGKKEEVPIPDILKDRLVGGNMISMHAGFYKYLFAKTADTTDTEDRTKYDEILDEVKPLLAKYPDHKLYVTGHSLGAALSTVASFYFACDPDIPKPVSCINFASPRVASAEMFAAIQFLEKTKQLRILRSVNEDDLVTTVPSLGFHHVGFEVTTYTKGWFRTEEADIYYPKPDEGFLSWMVNVFDNSMFANINLAYDHSNYQKKIELQKEFLMTKDLNKMYSDPKIVGFKLS